MFVLSLRRTVTSRSGTMQWSLTIIKRLVETIAGGHISRLFCILRHGLRKWSDLAQGPAETWTD
jgi:hypothetical protein